MKKIALLILVFSVSLCAAQIPKMHLTDPSDSDARTQRLFDSVFNEYNNRPITSKGRWQVDSYAVISTGLVVGHATYVHVIYRDTTYPVSYKYHKSNDTTILYDHLWYMLYEVINPTIAKKKKQYEKLDRQIRQSKDEFWKLQKLGDLGVIGMDITYYKGQRDLIQSLILPKIQ